MAIISYEIRGTNRIRNQLRTIAAMHPMISDPIIAKHAKSEQVELRNTPYPPKPATSTYIRKRFFGGIAGSFSAQKRGAGIWAMRNSRPYAFHVIGKNQAWMHVGRWWRMADEMQKRMPILTRALTEELESKLEAA